ncbi:MAG: NAD(P)H-hydrate dehydratase [Bdellovibrio sp.]
MFCRVLLKVNTKKYCLTESGARRLLPRIHSSDNKASRGRSLILAGSSEYPGAGILAARAAARAGSGYVILAQKNIPFISSEHPDFLPCDLNKTKLQDLNYKAVLIGPGFGVNEDTAAMIEYLKKSGTSDVVIDADALTVCAQFQLFPLPRDWIATPHAGELARCLGISVEEVNRNRDEALKKAHIHMGCVVLLKGHRTLMMREQRIYINKTGNSALAKAGTGDVLAGILTAFRAQGLSSLRSTLLGAYVHGKTAEVWVEEGLDSLSMMASDVVELIPRVLFELRQGR